MLTDPALAALVADKKLKLYEPPKEIRARRERILLLAPDVHDALFEDPWKSAPGETPAEARRRRRDKHVLLARFLNGDVYQPNVHVKVLKPTADAFRDLIEFRSGPPSPQTRLFALVYRPGIWIGLGFHLRDNLGDLGDPRWEEAAKATKDCWIDLFPHHPPAKAPFPCDTRGKLKALLND